MEEAVLDLALHRQRDGSPEFHGFAVAAELDEGDGRRLTATGTLYKVLDRLEREGLLRSRWESPEELTESRPRRRLYSATDEAAAALQRSRDLQRRVQTRPGLALS